jgi:hypothetical protein
MRDESKPSQYRPQYHGTGDVKGVLPLLVIEDLESLRRRVERNHQEMGAKEVGGDAQRCIDISSMQQTGITALALSGARR